MTLYQYYKENKFNPTSFDIFCKDSFENHKAKRDNLYINKLKIPTLIWKNSRVLEVGCSSGENSLIYALNGSKISFIEPFAESVDRLKHIFTFYKLEDAIESIIIDEIENVSIKEKYDVVIAEGFVNTLIERKRIVRALFNSLNKDGLFIIGTTDPTGFCLETIKAAIAQKYCINNNYNSIEDKVNAIRPFFEDDFNRIPHTRSFESWARDVLINPIVTSNPVYGFEELLSDLYDLKPVFFSSWPSYDHPNDLTWHKKIFGPEALLANTLSSYKFKCNSFFFGEDLDHKSSIEHLLEHQRENIGELSKKILTAVKDELHHNNSGQILIVLKNERLTFNNGKIRQFIDEAITVIENLCPEIYERCNLIRKYWGVHYHYIVFMKNNL